MVRHVAKLAARPPNRCQFSLILLVLSLIGGTVVGQQWSQTPPSDAPLPGANPSSVYGPWAQQFPSLPGGPSAGGWPPHASPLDSRPPVSAVNSEEPHQTVSELFEPAETAARVGDQYIFRGELIGDANIMLAAAVEKMDATTAEKYRAQFATERDRLVRQLLISAVNRKLMYIEFLRSIPAEKLVEAQTTLDERIGETFEENLFEMLDKLEQLGEEDYQDLARQEARLFRLAYLMKLRGLTSLRQLESLLREHGSSLEKQQKAYAERILGQQQMRNAIDFQPEITHAEMVDYYQKNQEEFRVPDRARWQQITIRFDRCESKQQAGEMIAALGNELVLGGTPFWAVAQRSSHGPNADEGGIHDWTEWGDLEVSQEINAAIFDPTMRVDELSRIIEDAEGLHIIKVVERTDAHVIDFTDAQVTIKRILQNRKRTAAIEEYVARLRERTPVWPEDLR